MIGALEAELEIGPFQQPTVLKYGLCEVLNAFIEEHLIVLNNGEPPESRHETGVVEGVTVHFVDSSLDGGPIVLQDSVPVLAGDTEETLFERIHAVEHRLFPRAVRALLEDRITVEGRAVTIREEP